MNRTVSRIKKRDGAVTDFVQEKITNAIYNAMQANGLSDKQIAKNISDIATFMLEDKFAGYTIPSVEQIQDIVEMVLMKQGYHDIAKSYILYRNRHKDIREAGEIGINLERLIKDYINDRDWKVKENSNEGVTSFSGLNARVAGEVLANFALNQLYSEKIKKAHNEGALHIHDLSYPIVGYCAGWSLENLLKKGFGHVPNQVHSFPAKHLETATLHMVNFIGTMQGEFAGAQAFSSVDTFLAPFIRTDNLEYENVKQDIQKLIFGLNVPSRWGWQTPFSNLTFDWTVPKDMKERCVIVGGEEKNFTYGECQGEMDMINKAFLELMIEGDQKGRVFTFPIPTYNLTRDFDWDSSNADLLFNVTAKYGIPYFQNYIGTNLDPGDIRAMCCRLNLDQRELIRRPGSIWGPGDSTGSIGVVTVNLNRIGYEAGNEIEFFSLLKDVMVLAKEALEIKRRVVNNMLSRGLMPYTLEYLGHFDNHFSTIGLLGMHETCMNFLGRGIGTPEGKEFTVKILKFMKETIRQFQEETGNLYNLEATPAESTSYRLARLDKQKYNRIITSGTDKYPYLTNSTQLNVDATRDIFDALEHQKHIQPMYTGGTIFALEITLIIVLLVLWFSLSSFQKSKSLIVLFLYSFPSQFLISIVPHEPVLLYFGKFYPPITAALVAVAGTIITEALNYSVFKFVTDFKLFKKSLQKKTVSRIVNLFNKAPFTAIWIAGLTPIPFYPIRFLVVLAHYPLIKYLLAVFLSRLPRFFILALIGYAIKIPDYLLIVLFVVLIISIYIPVLRNLIKKKKNKNRGDID